MRRPILFALAAAWAAAGAAADWTVQCAAFVPDKDFSALYPYFHEGWGVKDELGQPKSYTPAVKRGAYVHVFVRNAGAAAQPIERIALNGIDLSQQLAPRGAARHGLRPAHFLLNDASVTPPTVRERLQALGAPVWWRAQPNPVPPGGLAQITIRLRRLPRVRVLEVGLGRAARAALPTDRPAAFRVAGAAFDEGLKGLCVYLRHDRRPDFALKRLLVDGRPCRLPAGAGAKAHFGFLPAAADLARPLTRGAFVSIVAETDRGETAAAVVRAAEPFFALGMWGYRNDGLDLPDMVEDCLKTFQAHLFNTHMGMAGAHTHFLRSEAGLRLLKRYGLRLMARAPKPSDIGSPLLYARFLHDEPDCTDYRVKLPYDQRVGCFAQALAERQRGWTRQDPATRCLLNVDMTFKPENWLTYGQLPDIFALDPYFQNRLRDAYFRHPRLLRQFTDPYYIFAVAEIARSACAPHPLHIILNSTSYRGKDGRFRWGTPEEKRAEFYYALAAGARGISYWWFTPYGTYMGCGAAEPGAHAMLQEMARLNAEARCAAEWLERACRAPGGDRGPLLLTQPAWLFGRVLYAGRDAALLVLINRDMACDRQGTVVQPIPRARVVFRPPAWLKPASVFRFGPDGPTRLEAARAGDALRLDLREVKLTELIVVSSRASAEADAARRWRALQPRLQAVLKHTFEQYAADRKAAAEARERVRRRRREALFARYAGLARFRVRCSERLGTYGFSTERIWNPLGEKYNAQTWWVGRKAVKPGLVKGLRWRAPRPGRYRIAVCCVLRSACRLRVVDGKGRVLSAKRLDPSWPPRATVVEWETEVPAGAAVEFVQLGRDVKGEMGGRVSPWAYFVPAGER